MVRVRGSRVKLTLTGQGVGRATAILLPEPGLTATIVPQKKRDDNRVEVELSIAPDARAGIHKIGVITPMGVPGFQTFAVDDDAPAAEHEPNDRADQLKEAPTALPATFLGTIDRPGDVDLFALEARAGDELVFQVVARALGSALRPSLALLDSRGRTLEKTNEGGAPIDPVLRHTARAGGLMFLEVTDADYGGSGAHFYRIAAGRHMAVRSVFPLGVQQERTTQIDIAGDNLGGVKQVAVTAGHRRAGRHDHECAGRTPGGQARPFKTGPSSWPMVRRSSNVNPMTMRPMHNSSRTPVVHPVTSAMTATSISIDSMPARESE